MKRRRAARDGYRVLRDCFDPSRSRLFTRAHVRVLIDAGAVVRRRMRWPHRFPHKGLPRSLSTAEAFFPNRSGSLPRLATSMAFAPVLMPMATILQR